MSEHFPLNHFFKEDKAPLGALVNKSKNLSAELPKFSTSHPQDNLNKESIENKNLTSQNNDSLSEEQSFLANEILNEIKNQISETKYKAFFHNKFHIIQISDQDIVISVPTEFIAKMVKEFYLTEIENIISELIGNKLKIKFHIEQPKSKKSSLDFADKTNSNHNIQLNKHKEKESDLHINRDLEPSVVNNRPKTPSFKIGSNAHKSENRPQQIDQNTFRNNIKKNQNLYIDKDKNFENFVVGPSNNMAYSFALSVAKSPGVSYPQLFIYGNSGLGKTHLLNAISNYIMINSPALRITFVTAHEFFNEMVDAIRKRRDGQDTMNDFRRKYTDKTDVLIIDDIHELQNKTATQALFFNIFNELQAKKKQLIFTSDKSPSEITGLEERIKTRLNAALPVDISYPDLETRIAILKVKVANRGLFLDDNIINLIAKSSKTSIRELEGKLLKLHAYSTALNVDIDIEMAREQLGIGSNNESIATIQSIADAVCSYYDIPLGDLRGKTRKKIYVQARHMAMFLAHKKLKITLEEIGRFFSKRDHSTVIHSIKKVENQLNSDPYLESVINDIQSRII